MKAAKLVMTLVVALALLNVASAVNLNSGTILNATGSNTSIIITSSPILVDKVTVESDYIYLENASWINNELIINASTDINYSAEDIELDSSNLSWLSSSSFTTKHIASSVSNDFNATITVNVSSCTNFQSADYSSDSGTYTQTWTVDNLEGNCSGNLLTLDIQGIETASSSNIINIGYEFSDDLIASCTSLQDGLETFGIMLAIIVLAIIVVFVISMIVMNSFTPEFLWAGVIALVGGAIFLVLGTILISAIC